MNGWGGWTGTEHREALNLPLRPFPSPPRNGTGSEDPSDLSLCRMWGLVTLEVRGVDAG